MVILVVLSALLTFARDVVSHEHGVLALNDDTFEHATQAASGQTTGYWLVYFGKTEDVSDQKYWEAFAEQQKESQPWLLHAFVDLDSNPKLAERFDIVHAPSFILFRNRKMHRFPRQTKLIDPELVRELEEFTSGGWRNTPKEEVPKDQFSIGLSKTTIGLIVGGAAISSIALAVVGDWWGKYIEKTKPVSAKAQ